MEEFNHAKMDNDRCGLQDGCMSYTFTPPADKKDRLRSRLSKTMKRKMSKGFAVPLYEGGGFFIGLQHLIQKCVQQSAV